MSTYFENYGFTKTLIQTQNNNNILSNTVKWQSNYDGQNANFNLDIDNNGNKKFFSMKLDNNDINHLFGIQSVNIPIHKRLENDFLYNDSVALESILMPNKSRIERRKKYLRRNKTNKRKY